MPKEAHPDADRGDKATNYKLQDTEALALMDSTLGLMDSTLGLMDRALWAN